ncbi:MAG: gamma-glutamylcyclotransferase [Deltaproteobacteria bacterium]|nr:gamma-glutamylcyclotransferase [Deltaproteobacteria bacterium]
MLSQFFFYGALCHNGTYFKTHSGSAFSLQKAYTYGTLYEGKHGYAYLILDIHKTKKVYGEIFMFQNEEVFKKLDSLEGFIDRNNPSNLYERKKIISYTIDHNQKYETWAYLCPPHLEKNIIENCVLIQSGRWEKRPRL